MTVMDADHIGSRLPLRFIALICVVFFAVTFFVYRGAIDNQFVSWDDTGLITENSNVSHLNLQTVWKVFSSYDPELYIPLTFLSFQIDWLIGSGSSVPFHVTSLILHTINALLVTWLLFLLLRRQWIAIGLGLIFALHPLNVEAAIWASARKDVLSACFFFASLIAYIRWRDDGGKWRYSAALGLFLLALLSKVVVIMLPAVLLLVELQHESVNRGRMKALVPFIALAVIFGIIAVIGKMGVIGSSTPFSLLLLAGKSSIFYLQKFLMPTGLSVMYPWTKPISIMMPELIAPTMLSVALVVLALYLWNRSKLFAFGMLFYFLMLIPSFSNCFKGGAVYFASDRYVYISMAGLLLCVGILVSGWLDHAVTLRQLYGRQRLCIAATLIILFVATVQTSALAAVWHDNRSLYEHVLSVYPDSWAAHNNLGMDLKQATLFDDAVAEFRKALAIKDDPTVVANLASTLISQGNLVDAKTAFLHAIDIDPSFPESYIGLGNLAQRDGNLGEAIRLYTKSTEVSPTFANGYNNLGGVFIEQQNWPAAIQALRRSIQINPDFGEAWYNLAGALEQSGALSDAEDAYRQALSLQPNDPDTIAGLAKVLYDEHQVAESASLLQKALLISPSNARAIALALRMQQDGVASVSDY